MSERYILLPDHSVREETDLLEWAKWMQSADRKVAVDELDGITVSTVFLGLNHQFGDGPPLLFETMVFGGALDQEMDRYSTWDEAVEGHKRMVERVREALS